MDLALFRKLLEIDSTSGTERRMAEETASLLCARFTSVIEDVQSVGRKPGESTGKPVFGFRKTEAGDGSLNLLFTFGEPKVLFCTHLDTVPPYIPPSFENIHAGDVLPDGRQSLQDDIIVCGRGSCDAKGQILAMAEACERLVKAGKSGFGLLLLSGEETGSYGAKAYMADEESFVCQRVIVGEPTDNCCVSASKGTKSFNISIKGRPCHSGYPEMGQSAVETFVDFVNVLRNIVFPTDPVLGPTTWNIGKLVSDNPQNILSGHLSFRLYFRTTFASDVQVVEKVMGMATEDIDIEPLGGDTPMSYKTFPGIRSKPVSFGSDAPRLYRFPERALCGPGSILVAHTDKEYVLLSDLEKAVEQYMGMV